MGKPSENVRFLDDVDLTFSLDSRSSSGQQMTSMEISAKPIVFRASYRDINMIMTIVNKAIELSSDMQDQSSLDEKAIKPQSMRPSQTQITKATTSKRPVGKARVLMSKELVGLIIGPLELILTLFQLKGSFDGFRLVLIGDMHEQPMLHLKVKPFIIGAKDWSGEVQLLLLLCSNY
jgi:vacuolar protein sorting-associated protein 13A/C